MCLHVHWILKHTCSPGTVLTPPADFQNGFQHDYVIFSQLKFDTAVVGIVGMNTNES